MKKECGFFREKIPDYVMAELPHDLAGKVEEHLSICTDCWKAADEYKKTAAVAAAAMKVDFSDEVWEIQRREIIKRVTYRPDIPAEIKKFLVKTITTRKLAAGFAFLFLLAAGTGAGFKYYFQQKELQKERTITSRIDMFENMEIIERLDFYKKMSDTRVQL